VHGLTMNIAIKGIVRDRSVSRFQGVIYFIFISWSRSIR
jgi:hypothetical protein